MAELNLQQIAAVRSLTRAIIDFYDSVINLSAQNSVANSKTASGRTLTQPPSQQAIVVREQIVDWLRKNNLFALIPSGPRAAGPRSGTSFFNFDRVFLSFRASLPGLLNSAGINPSQSGAILTELDIIYTKYIEPYKNIGAPSASIPSRR